MMSRPRARLAFFILLIFAALFLSRTVLGQTAEPPSTSAAGGDQANRLQFLKARAPGLRPLGSNTAGPSASQEASPAEKPVAGSKPSSTPATATASRTVAKTTPKPAAASDSPAKSATAKIDPAQKPASTEKGAAKTASTTAKSGKGTPPAKTTASASTPSPEANPAKETTAAKTTETSSKTASTKEPSKKTASTEKPSQASPSKAPAKSTQSDKLAGTSRTSETSSKSASETPRSATSTVSASELLKKPITTVTPSRLTETESPESLRLTTARPRSRYPWKTNIVTTVFWVGERPSGNNFTPNYASSWDMAWSRSYGGYDNPDPDHRRNFIPVAFKPRQNNFYVALPYNDVTRGTTKPEARRVIPWFREAFEREGQSVCRNRWVAIRSRDGKIAYAQWSDCGPFRTDHWQYVFGSERPKPNLNQGAGLDVSPAVRDYLGIKGTDITDWKFVDLHEVPHGPWSLHGDNNTTRRDVRRMAKQSSSEG